MFNDDISAIGSTGCNVLNNQTTLYNYYNGVRKTFIQVGGKWIKTSETNYNTTPVGAVCVDISSLNSNAAYVPFYYMVAFVLFFVTVVVFIKSIRGIFYGP